MAFRITPDIVRQSGLITLGPGSSITNDSLIFRIKYAFAQFNLDDRAPERINENVLGTIAALGDYVRAQNIDIIYIALPMASQPRILKVLEELRDTTASIGLLGFESR